jgi:2-oxoglutarate ferredoxin oxidoreductase subunit gamma
MGLNLAEAAMLEGKNVTFLPSYGVEVRGGTANCTVAVSDEEIASPVASAPEFVVAMNQPSMVRFQNQLQSGGVLFYNSSLVNPQTPRGDIELVGVPAGEMAEKLDSPKSANMVMLGAFARKTNIVSVETVAEVLSTILKNKAKLIAVNKKALKAGYDLF